MKNSIITILFSLSLGISCSTAMASTHNGTNKPSGPTPEKTIGTYFKFPSVLIPQKGAEVSQNVKVEVVFTTDKLGNVTFVNAKTDNEELKKEIEKQFSAIKLPQMKEEVAHSVVLSFNYIGQSTN